MAACIADRPPSAPTPISRPMPRNPAGQHHQPVAVSPRAPTPGEALPEAPVAPLEVPAGQPEAPTEEPVPIASAGLSPADLIGLDARRATDLLGPAAAMECGITRAHDAR